MATTWDAEMQERLERVEQKVDKLTGDVTVLRGDFTDLRDDFAKLRGGFTQLRSDLNQKIDVYYENTRELIQKFAEGHAAALEGIARSLTDMRAEWQIKWADHDRALRDHASRITVLERRKSK